MISYSLVYPVPWVYKAGSVTSTVSIIDVTATIGIHTLALVNCD